MEIKKEMLCKSLVGEKEVTVSIDQKDENTFSIKFLAQNKNFETKIIHWNSLKQILFFEIDGKPYKVQSSQDTKENSFALYLMNAPKNWGIRNFIVSEKQKCKKRQATNDNTNQNFNSFLTSPLAGKIIKCNFTAKQKVLKNQCLFIIESMKIENEIRAETDAFIKTIPIKVGDLVKTNQTLIVFEEINPKINYL